MEKSKFIIKEIITIIIQYFLICFFFYYIFKTKLLISIIITLSIFLFCLIITILTFRKLSNVSFEEENVSNEIVENLIDKVNKEYKKQLTIKYVKIDELGPAWITKNIVFINTKYLFLEELLKGVVGHEIGHYFTEVCNYTFFDSLKIGSMISRIFRFLSLIIYNNKKKINSIGFILSYSLYILFSIFDIIFIYPLMRKDEMKANDYCVKLGYGKELRSYYGAWCLKYWSKHQGMIDLMHPDVYKMLNDLNKKLKVQDFEKNIFYDENHMYYGKIDTLTYTVPSNIKILENDTLYSETLIKLNTNDVENISYGAFKHLPNIETLILPNVKNISKNILINMKNLKEIIVYNEELYNQINEYQLNEIKLKLK